MPTHDDLGTRMKHFYEEVPKFSLYRRTPVAVRVDSRAFHTFTRGFQKPFDGYLAGAMMNTMKYLCQNIQGCVLGYQQSDEITLILVDYQTLNSGAFFDYEIQKMTSIIASMATLAFNRYFDRIINFNYDIENYHKYHTEDGTKDQTLEAYLKAMDKGAMFDCRVFNIPKEEVTNLLYWRQLDAERNSIQMMGQAHFSHKELQGLSCKEILARLELIDVDYNALPTYYKRGSCCVRNDKDEWEIDLDIPRFRGEDRQYIDKLIFVGE